MLYDIGFAIFSLFYLPTLIFKGKLHGDFLERFGKYDKAKRDALAQAKDAIWIQAVSVGEVALCRDLVPLLKARFPGRTIVFSTITKTGNELAKKLFAKDAVIIYFPLDFSFIVRKVVDLVKPKLYIMVETEIWPGFLKAIKHSKIPAVLINGRISDRSFGKYKLAKPFLRNAMASIDAFCMQSKIDADRIIDLGADPARVKVTSNMKFDVQINAVRAIGDELKRELGMSAGDELLVAGSTHSGEEEEIVIAYTELLKKFSRLKLLIAPRHVERSSEAAAVVAKHGFTPVLLSNASAIRNTPDAIRIYILDTIGRLSDFYSIATIVFIGGSLIKHGGQNPIEPAAYGKPVVFGPHMFNFKDIVKAFLAKDAAIRVSDGSELAVAVYGLLNDKVMLAETGNSAKEVVLENRGATEKVIGCVNSYIR